jgi:hypothetical protein
MKSNEDQKHKDKNKRWRFRELVLQGNEFPALLWDEAS